MGLRTRGRVFICAFAGTTFVPDDLPPRRENGITDGVRVIRGILLQSDASAANMRCAKQHRQKHILWPATASRSSRVEGASSAAVWCA